MTIQQLVRINQKEKKKRGHRQPSTKHKNTPNQAIISNLESARPVYKPRNALIC